VREGFLFYFSNEFLPLFCAPLFTPEKGENIAFYSPEEE